MTKDYLWVVKPSVTPTYIHRCSKCNKKMDFYCSEKFRINGNHTRLDIWLIYKCIKCDTTWKHEIYKGIKPDNISKELLDNFINNDKETAWEYAFDLSLIKSNSYVPNYNGIDYIIEKLPKEIPPAENFTIRISCPYKFELKLSKLLTEQLGISNRELCALAESGKLATDPPVNILKYRIRNDIKIVISDI